MRSRYTAFARMNAAYVLKSWAQETRPKTMELDADQKWLRLQVLDHQVTSPTTATVSFKAWWQQGTQSGEVAELSRFRREGEGWVYIDGDRA
jgi:SEC-C motif-containing protein